MLYPNRQLVVLGLRETPVLVVGSIPLGNARVLFTNAMPILELPRLGVPWNMAVTAATVFAGMTARLGLHLRVVATTKLIVEFGVLGVCGELGTTVLLTLPGRRIVIELGAGDYEVLAR